MSTSRADPQDQRPHDRNGLPVQIWTDLDDTLLDDRYDLTAAARAIDAVQAAGARVVIATSKTLAECIELRAACIRAPALVVENGSVLVSTSPGNADRGEPLLPAWPYARLIETLQKLRASSDYRFRGFADLSDAAVSGLTRLPLDRARRARQRLGSEPILWEDGTAALKAFNAQLTTLGLRLLQGGRFFHVLPPADKYDALEHLNVGEARGFTIACGDSENDRRMLEHADLAVLFPNRRGGYLRCNNPEVRFSPAAGPDAWLDTLLPLLTSPDRNSS